MPSGTKNEAIVALQNPPIHIGHPVYVFKNVKKPLFYSSDPRAPSEIYWTKQPKESVFVGDSRIWYPKNETTGEKVPKFWFVQRCDSGGNCLGENGDKENDYNIGDPQIFVVDNVTLEENGYYW